EHVAEIAVVGKCLYQLRQAVLNGFIVGVKPLDQLSSRVQGWLWKVFPNLHLQSSVSFASGRNELTWKDGLYGVRHARGAGRQFSRFGCDFATAFSRVESRSCRLHRHERGTPAGDEICPVV